MGIRSFGLVVVLLALGACSSVDDPLVEYSAEGGVGEFGTGTQHDIFANFAEALGTTDRVLFAFDSSSLDPKAQETVALWADFMGRYPEISVVVEGHCDERGSTEYNLALGDKRAKSAYDFLTTLGIDAKRLEVISYGEEFPLDARHNPIAWAKNRRAHFRVVKD
ncbi:MAG: OmpA family protein [Myxococcales bacterium]|nr:OmpA family protein [Myxococcales bacterium]